MCSSQAPTLLAPFAQLKDPRIDRTKVYRLLDLIFIALCAVVSLVDLLLARLTYRVTCHLTYH